MSRWEKAKTADAGRRLDEAARVQREAELRSEREWAVRRNRRGREY
jgi:hypothetical protein